MEKSIVFVDRKCTACNGEGCEACDGTGSVGSIEEREPIVFHPDGVSRALDAWRIAKCIGFRELGERLGVSVARASELCRGAGAERSEEEDEDIADFFGDTVDALFEPITLCFLEIGNGDIFDGIEFVTKIAERLRHARRKHAWPDEADGKYQALGVIHAEYKELEQAVEHGEGREREKDESLDVIATAARFWLGEHVRNS